MSVVAWAAIVVHGLAKWGHRPCHASMSRTQDVLWWMVMVVAMMTPSILESVRVTAVRSLRSRRHSAVGEFLLGYFAPWLVIGALVSLCQGSDRSHGAAVSAAAFACAAVWAFMPLRRRAFVECHRTIPLAPTGIRADADCLRFGFEIGRYCVVTCGPLMIACDLTGHRLVVMIATATIGWLERAAFRVPSRLGLAATAAFAVVYPMLVL